MRFHVRIALALAAIAPAFGSAPRPATPPAGGAAAATFREQVEADWLLQEKFRHAARRATPAGPVNTAQDAAGGVDGIKDGLYGFHTGASPSPWWHVDLGAIEPIARVVIWNRCDAVMERAYRLEVRLSDDGKAWRTAYTHDGTPFLGVPDGKPLEVKLSDARARFVRIEAPGATYLHLDEVEVFGGADPSKNIAMGKPADQVSVSQWSKLAPPPGAPEIDWAGRVKEIIEHCRRLAGELREAGVDAARDADAAERLAARIRTEQGDAAGMDLYFEARWIQRRLLLADPLLGFDSILFLKRVPGSFNHMSDQHLGWWSLPGGGIHILSGFKTDSPEVACISGAFGEPGSFQTPCLSYDGRKMLFAWCKYYPTLAGEPNKLDKGNVPEDAFYHVFEMGIDGTGLRQLTRGKYDDFDARYLPDGRIVFLSTRRGQSLQCGPDTARASLVRTDGPDVYVRCGGGPERPCVVYTLHTMDGDGSNLCAISPFEMFEWTPNVAADGTILYSRWDYIDRHNMPFMSLWSIHPDGTNAHLVYGNFTRNLHCTFEPQSVPGSQKILFTASAHHSQTMGSLVLLDPMAGDEGEDPITRLTPEVPFPEGESWPLTYYANPWPLSERLSLVVWGIDGARVPGPPGWDRWHSVKMPRNGKALYLLDAAGSMELLHRDPEIGCANPIPLAPRPKPPVLASRASWDASQEGRFLLADVYRGLKATPAGALKALRIVAVPSKTHPTMNFPSMGMTNDDPGKCVLGTVPVEEDGSAYFRVPAGVIVFFQALDARGRAIQTMRSTTHVQAGETLSCIGCHESRNQAPPQRRPLAASRDPSRIAVGPEGSWPLRYDRLVQPVLDKHCVRCHTDGSSDPRAAAYDLTAAKSYDALTRYGKPSLRDHVAERYAAGRSIEGAGAAIESPLLALLTAPGGHCDVVLDAESIERLIVWMDTYAQKLGSFGAEQERDLLALRAKWVSLLIEREAHRRRDS